MSSSKKDRTIAPRVGSRPSRAKHAGDRNVKPPAGYRPRGKRKPGEHAMGEQLAGRVGDAEVQPVVSEVGSCRSRTSQAPAEVAQDASAGAIVPADPDAPPPADSWWTDERERAFALALQGAPQHTIAGELGRDRHTVARWMDDERFQTRLYDENVARFKASRQRRSVQTLKLTDKANTLANKMIDKAIELADKGKDDLSTRLAARDWLQEFRENSRREDEIFGLNKDRLDVNVRGQVEHKHKGSVAVSFKAFLATSLQRMGVDVQAEEVDAGRADEALAAIAERALAEGTFLDDLVEREREQKLAPVSAGDR